MFDEMDDEELDIFEETKVDELEDEEEPSSLRRRKRTVGQVSFTFSFRESNCKFLLYNIRYLFIIIIS